MSNAIYVIRDPNKQSYPYKVGKHTGTKDQLSSRYRTYHPNHEVLLFIETNNASVIEEQVKLEFYRYRQMNNKGNLSEWIEYNINDIVRYIISISFIHIHEYLWSYSSLRKYNGYKEALNMFNKYLIGTYKLRYKDSNDKHGYSLSKNKTIALSYACYNILNPHSKIVFENMDEYERYLREIK